jgi:membrane protease YdiL (CAAX protease family)
VCADHRAWEIALLALMSGFAEELFFRGALAGQFGALMATLAFAIFHWPINERYALWPVFALVAGAVFQVLMQRTGSLWAPIAAHVVVNAVNLARIRIKYGHLR